MNMHVHSSGFYLEERLKAKPIMNMVCIRELLYITSIRKEEKSIRFSECGMHTELHGFHLEKEEMPIRLSYEYGMHTAMVFTWRKESILCTSYKCMCRILASSLPM